MVPVIIPNVDIPASTCTIESRMTSSRSFQVPESVVLAGGVTSVHQPRKRLNSGKILAGELIPAARIKRL